MSVSIVIPCYGDKSQLDACLESLEQTTTVADGLLETILVMNGTGWVVPGYPTIQNETNTGFANACNSGADMARSEMVCFLNQDTILEPNWLPPLVDALDDPGVAMSGPRIVHMDGSLQTASGIRTWHSGGNAGGEELKIDGPSCDTDGVTAACMLIRKDVFTAAGAFYSGYWCGNEDVDLCLTIQEMGWRARYAAESQIQHAEHGSGADRWVRVHENVALLNQRWGNR